jgi:hypothetical protein
MNVKPWLKNIEPLQPSKSCPRSTFNDMFLIHSRVILYSEMVEILVGKDKKEAVIVHKDLLTLHSMFFTDLFIEKDQDVDRKISISAKPSLFADFISWIYTGEFLKVENNALAGGTTVDDLWALGSLFRAPAFQNFCMDDCRNYCKASETDETQPWPFIQGIKQMYSLTQPEAKLRKLAIHSLSYKNPLQENKKGSPAWKEWKSLLSGHVSEDDEHWLQEIQDDFVEEIGKDWNGIPPVSTIFHCTTLSRKDSSRHKHYLILTNDDPRCLLIKHY